MPDDRRVLSLRPVSAVVLAAVAMTVVMLLIAALGEWALIPSSRVREIDEGGAARATRLLTEVPWLEAAALRWSDLTLPWVVHGCLLVVSLGLLAVGRVTPRALLTVPIGLLGWFLGVVCKELVERPRPAEAVVDYSSWSYPSGHATNIALGAVLLIALLSAVRTAWIRRGTAVFVLVSVVLTAADRLVLGVHYPSDVLAGLALGTAMAWAGLLILRPLPRSHVPPPSRPRPSARP